MNKLKVGASKKIISVPQEMLPYPDVVIFGDNLYTSIRKDIHVRAIAIDNGEKRLLFLVQETGAVNVDLIKKSISEKYDFPPEGIFICNTHNHSAPPAINLSVDTEWGVPVPEVRYRYSRFLIEQVVAAAGEALANQRPARFGFGKGNSYINVNRDEHLESGRYVEGRNFERPSDKTLSVLKFEDLQGKLIAVLMNYSVHSVMCFRVADENGNKCSSGDLAGEIAEFMEDAFKADGSVVAWTVGSGGNQNPVLSCYHNYHPDGTYEMTRIEWNPIMWDLARHLGQKQGMDALRILKGISELHEEARIEIVDRVLSLPGTRVEGFTKPMIMNANLIDDSQVHNVDGDPLPVKLKLVQLGDVTLAGLELELMSEIGLRMKEKLPNKDTVLISYYDENSGGRYLVDQWGFKNRTFAYYRNKVKDACTEEKLTEMLLAMVKASEAG
jgi:neutral ceramidase